MANRPIFTILRDMLGGGALVGGLAYFAGDKAAVVFEAAAAGAILAPSAMNVVRELGNPSDPRPYQAPQPLLGEDNPRSAYMPQPKRNQL